MARLRNLFQYKKFRLYLGWLLALDAFCFVPTRSSLLLGALFFIVLGESLRVWASGSIVKSKILSVSGPYRFVRNPLYLGSFLIGIGFTLLLWQPFLFILYLFFFWFFYWGTIQKEEESLKENFGDPYRLYLRHVPRLFPRLVPYREKGSRSFRFRQVFENGETITLLTILFVLFLLHVKRALERERPFERKDLLIGGAALLVGIEIFREVIQRRLKEAEK